MDTHFTREELLNILGRPSISVRDRALISFLFITGARVREVIGAIRKKDITFEKLNDVDFLVVNNVLIEKRKTKLYRNIPIRVDREKPFVDMFLAQLARTREGDDVIFDINRFRVFQITQKITGRGPHFLRHSRLTQLRTVYKFDAFALQRFVGWSSPASADPYVHLRWDDVANMM